MRVKAGLRRDRATLTAAGVAFFAFLATLPALAAVISVYGLIGDPDQVGERVEDAFQGLPSEARDLLAEQLERITAQSGGALSFGLIGSIIAALWAASSAMNHLNTALNESYDEQDERGWVKRRGQALLMTLVAVVFVVAVLVGTTLAPAILDRTGLGDVARVVIQVAAWPLAGLLFMVGLSALYRYGPERDNPQWRWTSAGAGIAVVLWLLATLGLRIYAENFGNVDETYGSLAAVVLLMLWLLATAYVVLLGARINAELEHQTVIDTTDGATRPMGQRDAHVADEVGPAREELDDRNARNRQTSGGRR